MTNEEKWEQYQKWCRANDLPNFVPEGGKCFCCKENVFETTKTAGYPSTGEFITGCPHCHRTFCD